MQPAFPRLEDARARCVALYGIDPEASFRIWMHDLTGLVGKRLEQRIADDAKRVLRTCPVEPLPITSFQKTLLRLIASGLTNDELAEAVGLSRNTVQTHLKDAFIKLHAHNRAHAVVVALAHNML